MPRDFKRALILVGVILLALLPLVELFDHWESFGSDPEFVSVCTVLGIAFALALLFRAALVRLVKQLQTVFHLPLCSAEKLHAARLIVQFLFPRIRAPIRI